MKTDYEIWEDFKNGDNRALSHIYLQHVQLLFSYGKKFSKDDDLVKDTIQDLFVDIIRTRGSLGETDNIKFYLLAAFKRKLIKNIRKQIPSKQIHENLQLKPVVNSAEVEIIRNAELNQREILIQKAFKELSQRQREIIFYRFTCNFDYNQICELMSLKYDSARKQVFRALKALEKALTKSGYPF